MTQWLQRIMAEIDAVTEEQANSLTPDDAGCPHEHVVGTLDLGLKKLRFLAHDYLRREQELATKLLTCSPEDELAVEKEFDAVQGKGELLGKLFWTSVREAFPELRGKSSIGVRTGDNVIWSEHGDDIQMVGNLMMMFGGLFGDAGRHNSAAGLHDS